MRGVVSRETFLCTRIRVSWVRLILPFQMSYTILAAYARQFVHVAKKRLFNVNVLSTDINRMYIALRILEVFFLLLLLLLLLLFVSMMLIEGNFSIPCQVLILIALFPELTLHERNATPTHSANRSEEECIPHQYHHWQSTELKN